MSIIPLILFGAVIFPLFHKIKIKRWFFYILFLIGFLIFIIQVLFYFGFFVDDAFISLRYAKNLADGYGLNFNRDFNSPVEGYSNFLWIILEVPCFLLGLEPILYVKVLSLILGLAGLLLVYKLGLEVNNDKRVGLLCLWALALTPMFALWTMGGLEVPLYIVLGLSVVLMWMKGRSGFILGLSMLLVSLARNEGIVYFIIWLVMVLVNGKGRMKRDDIFALFVFMLGFIIYEAFRIVNFGDILPNTFYAKVKFGWDIMIGKVIQKAPFYFYLSPLMLLAVGNFIGKDRDRRIIWLAIIAISIGITGMVAYREWMPGWRYVLPMVPFITVLGIRTLVRVFDKSKMRYGLAMIVLSVVFVHLLLGNIYIYNSRTNYKTVYRGYLETSDYLKETNKNREFSIALQDMGIIPFYSGATKAYDFHPEGILSRETTRSGYDYRYFINEKPDFFILLFDNLPPDGKPANEINNKIYEDSDFKNNYQFINAFRNDEGRTLYIFSKMK